jgi:hypothetical protein
LDEQPERRAENSTKKVKSLIVAFSIAYQKTIIQQT